MAKREVYVTMPTSSFSSPGTYTVSIPSNGYNITVQVRGARGGRGGTDASAQGGDGGLTTLQNFTLTQNFGAKTITCYVGGRGGNGANNQPNAAGGGGGGGMSSGGRGGNAGDPPYSGGGGGGGGASGIAINGVNAICMGGAGGGGGASDNRNGGGAGNTSANASATSSVTPTNGGGGGDPGGTDGGGGGGGGGGDNGGGGGGPGQDNNRGGGGGGAGGSTYNSSLITTGSANTNQTDRDGFVSVSWLEAPATGSISASPQTVTSSTGTPSYSTAISWTSQYADTRTITSSAGETFSGLGTSGTLNITNLPQSNANGVSPATRTYTLTVTNPSGSNVYSVTVSAYNDNTPSNSWTTSFSNLDPVVVGQVLTLGTLSGVDMPTLISVSGAGNFVGSGGSFLASKLFNNGDVVQLKTNTLGFNTDVSGQTGIYGKTNTKTVTVTTPSGSFNVSVTTRAPRIREDFNYTNNINNYPYEDIDLIANAPTQYAASAQLDMNDIEIAQEIKVDKPDAQVSVNGGSWQNVRQI